MSNLHSPHPPRLTYEQAARLQALRAQAQARQQMTGLDWSDLFGLSPAGALYNAVTKNDKPVQAPAAPSFSVPLWAYGVGGVVLGLGILYAFNKFDRGV